MPDCTTSCALLPIGRGPDQQSPDACFREVRDGKPFDATRMKGRFGVWGRRVVWVGSTGSYRDLKWTRGPDLVDLSVETAQRPRIREIGEIFENPSDAFGPLGRPIPQYPNAFGDLPLEHLLGKRGGLSFGGLQQFR